MPTGKFVASQELQAAPQNYLRHVVDSGEPCYITEDGKAKAVLMDINRYNQLMDLVEDAESPKGADAGDETRKLASVRTILKRSSRVIRPRR